MVTQARMWMEIHGSCHDQRQVSDLTSKKGFTAPPQRNKQITWFVSQDTFWKRIGRAEPDPRRLGRKARKKKGWPLGRNWGCRGKRGPSCEVILSFIAPGRDQRLREFSPPLTQVVEKATTRGARTGPVQHSATRAADLPVWR